MILRLVVVEELLSRAAGHNQRLHGVEVGLAALDDVAQVDAALLVLVGAHPALVSHCDDGKHVGPLAADGVGGGLGHHEGTEIDDVGVGGGGHAHGTGAGGLHQALALHVGLGNLVGRVAEVEPLGTLPVHLAHQQVAHAAAVQFQRVLSLGHQRNLRRPPVEGYGGGGEGPEHVYDNGCAVGFPGVAH